MTKYLLIIIASFGFYGVANAGTIMTPANNLGLVGYWSFEDATGTKATDFSGKGNTGTLYGNTAWVGGKFGKALDFPFSDYNGVSLPSNVFSSNVLTISMWVKFGAINIDSALFSIKTSDTDAMELFVSSGSSRVWGGNWDNKAYSGAGSISVGPWHHIALTSTGSITTIYVNGQASGTTGTTNFSTYSLVGGIGFRASGLFAFDGLIDDVRVYNRALSATEVSALYNTRSNIIQSGDNRGLVGYWSFEDATGTKATDFSGKGNTATLVGATSGWAGGKFGKALSLPNFGNYATVNVNAGLPVFNPSGQMTLSAWFYKSDAGSNSGTIYSEGNSSGSGNFNIIVREGAGDIQVYAQNDSGSFLFQLFASGNFEEGWHNVVVRNNNGLVYVYVDTVLKDSTSYTPSTTTLNQATIGLANTGAYNFYGRIDELRVYNRFLSIEEMAKLYQVKQRTIKAKDNRGLVGYWSFEDATGTKATDFSGKGNTANLIDEPAWANGKLGGAIRFTTQSNYVLIPNNPTSLQIDEGTVSAWIKTTNAGSSYRGIVVKQNAYGFFLVDNVFTIYDWGTANARSTGVNLADGKWHHVVETFRSGVTNGTELYIDGVNTLTTTMTIGTQTTTGEIGRGGAAGAAQLFDGFIDDVRIYNRALSAEEVLKLYNSY